MTDENAAGRDAGAREPSTGSGTGSEVPWAPFGLVTLVAVAFVAAALAGMGLAPSGGVQFEVYDHGAGEVVYERPVDAGETFRLEHTHSVTKRPVVETFGVDDTPQIVMVELRFDEFGPNLPSGAESYGDRTTTFLHESGAYRVLHHNYPIGTVPIRIGSEAVNHVLVFADGERLRLLDHVRRGEHVEFAVQER